MKTAIISSVLALLFVGMPAHAATALAVTSTTWTQVSTSATFFLQSKCGQTLYVKPAASQPAVGPGDTDDAFIIRNIGDTWVQTIPGDTWWVRSQSRPCNAVVQEIS